MKQIKTIGDKPILYDRMPDKGYGVPVEGHHFYGTVELETALESLAVDLLTIGWLPHIEAFLSAGFQVNKGSVTNAHRRGIAWDWDGVTLIDNPLNEIPAFKQVKVYKYAMHKILDHVNGCEISRMTHRSRTQAACLCSRHFGVVLGDFYDKAHGDHLHCDLSKLVAWRGSTSQIGLVQATLNAWFDSGLKVDRILGVKTQDAWSSARNDGIGFPHSVMWLWLIDTIAMER